jgi:hypothetical protein
MAVRAREAKWLAYILINHVSNQHNRGGARGSRVAERDRLPKARGMRRDADVSGQAVTGELQPPTHACHNCRFDGSGLQFYDENVHSVPARNKCAFLMEAATIGVNSVSLLAEGSVILPVTDDNQQILSRTKQL